MKEEKTPNPPQNKQTKKYTQMTQRRPMRKGAATTRSDDITTTQTEKRSTPRQHLARFGYRGHSCGLDRPCYGSGSGSGIWSYPSHGPCGPGRRRRGGLSLGFYGEKD